MSNLDVQLKLPDFWQQEAVRALKNGDDILLAAPTGAGKTYVFELLIESGWQGRCIYTVPTRALANDKLLEWTEKGWRVGIATGDRAENLDASIIVATLETQKWKLLNGEGPDLLVIDEYQMLGDSQRGLNYELAIAAAPHSTQLLLMSGSVGNPESVAQWLERLGRTVSMINHEERPVPLEEIHLDNLPRKLPSSVKGFWPRAVARALKAGMAPLIAFAPRRNAAEKLAIEIARMLPEADPLVLTPEQEKLAGDQLKRLLRARVAYHHSGLNYGQRAGLIEPLAKSGQLRVVVATMGLAAGINFSMRSVVVTDREYRTPDGAHLVRPDELLQMFGRAGRRGLDKIGYILSIPGKPRLSEARPLHLQRINQLDWPSLLGVMQQSILDGEDAVESARRLTERLFSIQRIPIGFSQFEKPEQNRVLNEGRRFKQAVKEIETPDGQWERERAPLNIPLSDCWIHIDKSWIPALQYSGTLSALKEGNLCKIKDGGTSVYGREIPVARDGYSKEEGELVISRWVLKHLKELRKGSKQSTKRTQWTLAQLETVLGKHIEQWSTGGRIHSWDNRHDTWYVILTYETAEAYAIKDSTGKGLINPPRRNVIHEGNIDLPGEDTKVATKGLQTVADAWYQLGLIDEYFSPTRRGILTSYFNYGEGLAIAAALEDHSYPVEDLILHIANLRAGHRFSKREESSSRLGSVSRSTYRDASFKNYLNHGVPINYGDGAAEVILLGHINEKILANDFEELRMGDIERTRLEWRSLLKHIAQAPDLNWNRWVDLKFEAKKWLQKLPSDQHYDNLPPLTPKQRQRHKSFLTFE